MEQITQTDIDNLADMIWWIKGFVAGAKEASELCPFKDEHVDSLAKVRRIWKQESQSDEAPTVDEQFIEEIQEEDNLGEWGFLARYAQEKTMPVRVCTQVESRVGYFIGAGRGEDERGHGLYSILSQEDDGDDVRMYYKDITSIEFLGDK